MYLFIHLFIYVQNGHHRQRMDGLLLTVSRGQIKLLFIYLFILFIYKDDISQRTDGLLLTVSHGQIKLLFIHLFAYLFICLFIYL